MTEQNGVGRSNAPTRNNVEPTTSAIEELCRLLDERGVEWTERVSNGVLFTFTKDGRTYSVFARDRAGLEMWSQYLTPAQAIEATLGQTVTGETSDGYHTFNELYHHRAVLFSVIVRDHPKLAWKSKMHHDGTMYDGMFIVGIETPHGQATYHYDIEPYWEMFDCKELERAPEWDGHTPDQAIERIATLGRETCTYEIAAYGDGKAWFVCSKCGGMTSAYYDPPKFCPHCSAKVVDE